MDPFPSARPPEAMPAPAPGRPRSAGVDVIRKAVAFFLPLAVLATLGCGLTYVEVQQDLRNGANDPQYQMAEDAAAKLNSGSSPTFVVNRAAVVDLSKSLATFVIVFDSNHKVLDSNASLDGGIPVPPDGVLDKASSGTPNAVTWQPRDGVRVATVTAAWSGGYVLVGRSLTRVDQQEDRAGLLAGIALPLILLALAFASLVSALLWPQSATAAGVA